MTPRLNPFAHAGALFEPVLALNKAIDACGLERSLLHLVKLRASQINGCGYCIDMHVKEARADGDSEQRLHLVSAWRESPLFTARERAAFDWTEKVTKLNLAHPSDDDFNRLADEFGAEELVKLTLAICMINTWNRIAVTFRMVHPEGDSIAA